jgi:bile acid:Na+ symporter, BASS family
MEELMDNPIIGYFITATIFSLMFALGINHSFRQVTYLLRQPGLMLRSLLSVIVIVPALVVVLVWVFSLPPAVATGLAVLAAAPGAPVTYKRVEMAGGEMEYGVNLQLTLALLAVVVTPLTLAVFYSIFDLMIDRVAPLDVARQVAQVTFLPVIAGFLVRYFLPAFADRVGNPLRILGNILLIILLLLAVVALVIAPDLRMMLNVGWEATMAIVLMVALSLASGHFLGGPAQERRTVLAITSIARNFGLALFIAGLTDYGQEFVPTLVTYLLLGGVLSMPYMIWSKRRLKKITSGGNDDY